ncbi:hypothetical protein [Lewinella sp. JB7]|uniref:hypothetical protein n=1 Tax=Lewinella sp. JB7 TaxID=2962887 RepID=UPI0020CA12BD|nr:hypothetical protein [Lewinella sp. JB7]MCP9234673.1 hypothetical protein [Lewinella sp. JB7]
MGFMSAPHPVMKGKQTIKNVPQQHAFALVGEQTLFLCHQIMTHMEPHCYEFILEVEIPPDKKKVILADRKSTDHAHYFGNREGGEFTLPSVVAGRVTSFRADVWTSIPDSNPPDSLPQPPWGEMHNITPWLSDVEVTIVRTVHYRHLNRNEVSRRFEEYILFGRGKEAHILHSVRWQPDYDHLASLATAPDWITEDQLVATVNLSVPGLPVDPKTPNCACPFADDSVHEVLYFGFTEFHDVKGHPQNQIPKLEIHVARNWWYSTKILNYWENQACPDSTQID